MGLLFFNIEQVQDYLETLAQRHKKLQHGVNGLRAFARYESDAQMADLKKGAGRSVLIVADTGGHRTGHKDDRMLQRELVARVLSYAKPTGDIAAQKQAAIKEAEEIMMDLMTEMELRQEQDLDQDIGCGVMHFLRPEEFSWEPVEEQPVLLNHYGFDLTIPFRVYMARHNPDAWDPEA